MKKHLAASLITLLLLSWGSTSAIAKRGSTPPPPAPVVSDPLPPAPEPTPEPEPEPVPAPAEPEPLPPPVTETVQPVPPAPAPVNTTQQAQEQAAAAAAAQAKLKETQQVLCNDLDDLSSRVQCRLERTHEELESEPYEPEGCKWGDTAWQESCKVRYAAIYPCYDLPVGQQRIGCIKAELRLPEVLTPLEQFCAGEHESCGRTYRAAVHQLIVARFYDAEERAEDWYEDERLSKEDTLDFVVFITQAKWDFQDAQTKADRKAIIQRVDREWNTLLTKIQP